MSKSDIALKPINDILGFDFYIPSYQRGYRWDETQVEALLNDLWEYKEDKAKNPFYCLQPIVVKPYEKDGSQYWEVIDGQQRLTTIFILLHYFNQRLYRKPKPIYSIDYETRGSSKYFSEHIEGDAFKDENIDFFHIHTAYKTIDDWFENHINTAADEEFRPVLVNNTKIIWYEVDGNTDSIDIFTRLNIGKIPLTNAELIKALFLRKSNFIEEEQQSDTMYLKHLKIASEWNAMENKLQSDDFWYFLYNPMDKKDYDKPRIEYLFDLIINKTDTIDNQYTFTEFEKKFQLKANRKDNGKPKIDDLWLEVKQYFQTLEDWFQNRELYHLIGFLIANDVKINTILEDTREKQQLVSKRDFKIALDKRIKTKVNVQLTDLTYGNKVIKDVLLLFNIITLNNNKKSNVRFPFDLYKKTKQRIGFDVEHIRSQTPLEIKEKDQAKWIMSLLEFYTGKTAKSEITEKLINQLSADEKIKVNALLAIDLENIDKKAFDDICKAITTKFEEHKADEAVHGLGNLALLNADINRGYGNSMFPIKRKWLLKEEKAGTYIPLCTKNVFMKSYTNKISEVMYWQPQDAIDYVTAIKNTLTDYLPTQNPKND
jgi:uncharacterized protein with ParB-like and HNH nuclease domain